MTAAECPSCGTPTGAGASECGRCGRRLAWDTPASAPPSRPPGSLFGDDEVGEPDGLAASHLGAYEAEALREARDAARNTLVAGVVGLVALAVLVRVFAVAEVAAPDPTSPEYADQYAAWVAGNTVRGAARGLAAGAAAALAGYALVRGLTARSALLGRDEPRAVRTATAAVVLGALELVAVLTAVLVYRPF